jgi:hypothetical protein
MSRTAVVGALLVGLAGTSEAGGAPPLESAESAVAGWLIHNDRNVTRFMFWPEGVVINGEGTESGGAHYADQVQKPVVGVATKEDDVAWVAFDLALYPDCFEMKGCKKKASRVVHATALQQSGSPLAMHIADPFTGKEYAAAIKNGRKLEALPKKIDKGAEAAVKVFESTISDPKAFAATVSARPDVILFGSEAAERWVGGDKVKAAITKWKLGFKVRDGIQAGVSGGGTVAWIAANVDAAPVGKAGTASPYRLTAIYEKTGADWKVVALQFSFYVNPYEEMP